MFELQAKSYMNGFQFWFYRKMILLEYRERDNRGHETKTIFSVISKFYILNLWLLANGCSTHRVHIGVEEK